MAAQNTGLTNEGVVTPPKAEAITIAFSQLALTPVEGEVKKRQERHLVASAGDTKSFAERALSIAELEPGSERALEAARAEQIIQEEQAKSLSKIKAKSSYVRKDHHFYFETEDLDDNDITYLSTHLKTNYPDICELTLSQTKRYRINALATVLAENPGIKSLTLSNCVNHHAWIGNLASLIQNNKSLRILRLTLSDGIPANIIPVVFTSLVDALCSNASLISITGLNFRKVARDRDHWGNDSIYTDVVTGVNATYGYYDAVIDKLWKRFNLEARDDILGMPKAKP